MARAGLPSFARLLEQAERLRRVLGHAFATLHDEPELVAAGHVARLARLLEQGEGTGCALGGASSALNQASQVGAGAAVAGGARLLVE